MPRALAATLVVAAGLAACSAPPPPPLSNQSTGAPRRAYKVTMKRTPCFGMCPAYSVTIHPDGRVDYVGESDVAEVGVRHAQISPDRVETLAAAVDKVRFFELDASGQLPRDRVCVTAADGSVTCSRRIVICTDTTSAIITVTRNGRSHEVTNQHCAPSPVDPLEEEIDVVANTGRWVRWTE